MSDTTSIVTNRRRSSNAESGIVQSTKGRWGSRTLIIIAVVLTLFPFYWMLRTALSNNRAMFSDPLNPLPVDFTLGAFKRVLGIATTQEALAEGGSGANIDFGRYLLNTIIVCVLIVVFQLLFSTMAAYAFGVLEWRGRDAVFAIFLIALLVPGIFTLLPNFLLIKELGLLNTYLGIALPQMLMAPFAIFFLRQFFLSVNRSIMEAAHLDGANAWQAFWRVAVPTVTPQIITIAILQFINAWNEYLWPLLVGTTEETKVLTVGLGVFKSQTPQGSPDWAGLMAGALLTALPIFIIFMIFGRRIVTSVQSSGVK